MTKKVWVEAELKDVDLLTEIKFEQFSGGIGLSCLDISTLQGLTSVLVSNEKIHDIPEPVELPLFAVRVLECGTDKSLKSVFESIRELSAYAELDEWLDDWDNVNQFVKAWQTGEWKIRKEPKWKVSYVETDDETYYFHHFVSEPDPSLEETPITGDGYSKEHYPERGFVFDDKRKAELVAELIGGEVEEVKDDINNM